MARLHYVKSAAKDYPEEGIKKGEPYYWWQFYGQRGRNMSRSRPRPSQLTRSRWGEVLALYETFEDSVAGAASVEDVKSAFEEMRSGFEDLQSEFEEAADNQEEHFPGSEQAERIRERSVALEDACSEIDSISDNLEEEEECPDCAGSGECIECSGSGTEDPDEGGMCTSCEGTCECQECGGSGEVEGASLEAAKEEASGFCCPDDPY